MWRRETVSGDGEYALLARCRVLTIELHETLDKAQTALRMIDSTGCGSACRGDHEVIRLIDPASASQWESRRPEPVPYDGPPPFSGALPIVDGGTS
jgi:hypothetical protein